MKDMLAEAQHLVVSSGDEGIMQLDQLTSSQQALPYRLPSQGLYALLV